MTVKIATSIIVLIFFLASCKKDSSNGKLTPSCNGSHPTYNSGIKAILDASCAISGCHTTGFHHGSFAAYSAMSPSLSSGNFRQVVLIDQTMPQGGKLSQAQIDLIQCWVNDGYPEN